MAKSKLNLENSNLVWNPERRYKVNSVVEYLGKNYQNLTGKNSEPGVGSDWFVPEYSIFVPYTGAEEDVDLGEFQLKSNGAIFTDSVVIPEGLNDEEAVNFGQLKIDTGVESSITTVDFGGIPAGTDIQNLTFNSILIDAMIAYLYPQFTSASCTYPSTVEVGTTVAGTFTFNWGISNPTNVKANTVMIFDVNDGDEITSGLANDGTQDVLLNNVVLNANNATQKWKIKAQNTKNEFIESGDITTTAIYPIFYGVANSQPTANQALINSGTKAIVASTGTLNITFGASGQYLWFAHPALNPTKTKWYVTALNNGNIGSISDLFNAPTTVSITTVMWAGVSYKIYISNIPTTTSGNMELKNS